MTKMILASYPALTVLNPKEVSGGAKFDLDVEGCIDGVFTSSLKITIKSFARDKYEYIRNFYFGGKVVDGVATEVFCNPDDAVASSTPSDHKATFGYELDDVVTIQGEEYFLRADHNYNIRLEKV